MSAGEKPLTKPALGRPFQLGMLYDCRNDGIVPGLSLWDKQTIEKNTRVVPKEYSSVHVITSEDIDSKMVNIGADVEIKLSMMNGMIDVYGSAHFVAEKKDSEEHSRVVLHYTSTARFEELLISKELVEAELKKESLAATHLVTGILYGADAYFLFDLKKSEHSDKLEIAGKLEASVKNLGAGIGFAGSVSGSFNKDDIKRQNEISCKFIGDFILNPLPTNYEEAIEAYKTLTKNVGKGDYAERAVPMTVWLLPLSALHRIVEGSNYVKKIDDTLASRLQKAMEELGNVKAAAAMLLSKIENYSIFFDQIQDQIREFMSLVNNRIIFFVTKMKTLLPKIRGGVGAEQELKILLNRMKWQPFDIFGLQKWLEGKKTEINTLKDMIDLFESKKSKENFMYIHVHAHTCRRGLGCGFHLHNYCTDQ